MAKVPWLKPATFALLSLPLLWVAFGWTQVLTGTDERALSSEPVAYTINFLGIWTLRILLLALAITPINRLTGWTPVMTVRRMVGLFAFAYALVHLSVFFALDLLADFGELAEEVVKRPFILFGMAAFLTLLPLAITSTRGWVKRLGGRNWQRLHRIVYAAGVLGVIHFVYRVKGNQAEPWIYAAILAVLLAIRFVPRRKGGYLSFARA